MISLDKAKRLKELGLAWEPDFGDLYQLTVDGLENIYCYDEGIQACRDVSDYDPIWLPSLSQLLAKIRQRGWIWKLWQYEEYSISIMKGFDKRAFTVGRRDDHVEDCAASALLWILEQEAIQ